MPPSKSFEDTIREELQIQLLNNSRRFSSLYFWALLANTAVGTIACIFLLMGKSQESIVSAVTGFGSTAVVTISWKESHRSLVLLIDYLEDD
jgi:phosphate/sulfate permease